MNCITRVHLVPEWSEHIEQSFITLRLFDSDNPFAAGKNIIFILTMLPNVKLLYSFLSARTAADNPCASSDSTTTNVAIATDPTLSATCSYMYRGFTASSTDALNVAGSSQIAST
jgi:hypothetical protein